ncbi:hypothetical protein [Ralstonia phage phiRSL1]|uniref:Uncharacterized protein n=1 Tax=Ralstonia phage phiRSL1 TaxID=1980924 RepID=B2ZXU4_9CAUD|nr:hypothetical protein RSL1_ORF074 [Ralstonia phage phiRSL1]BAG41520.1 hypothetical protein [Ralstonia phage phiRSL1]
MAEQNEVTTVNFQNYSVIDRSRISQLRWFARKNFQTGVHEPKVLQAGYPCTVFKDGKQVSVSTMWEDIPTVFED